MIWVNPDIDEPEYLMFREVFRKEICGGHDSHAVLKELDARGFLNRKGQDMTIKPRLPGLGPVRVYSIRAAIVQGDEC